MAEPADRAPVPIADTPKISAPDSTDAIANLKKIAAHPPPANKLTTPKAHEL